MRSANRDRPATCHFAGSIEKVTHGTLLLHLVTAAFGTRETSRRDPVKSAYEGQSGHAADIVRGPTLTDGVEKGLVIIGEP
jgi:hypothetical protein